MLRLSAFDAPHIRHQENTRSMMVDVILALLFLYAMAYFYHGARAVGLGVVSVAAATVSDAICTLIYRRRVNVRDLSAVVTGLLIPLLMPASISYFIVVVAAVFGIVVAKHPFGGVGHNVFNPAAAGFAFVAICFTDLLFTYPMPLLRLPLFGPVEATLVNSPAFTLALGGQPGYSFVEMLLGNYPGPMGATNILVVLACLLFLVLRSAVNWRLPLSFFLISALVAFLFPQGGAGLMLDGAMRLRLAAYEMMSGCLLLGGVFLLGDPVTTPTRGWSKVAFAVLTGIMVMIFQRFGDLEEGLPFALLLMNASVWGIDMAGEYLASRLRLRRSTAASPRAKARK